MSQADYRNNAVVQTPLFQRRFELLHVVGRGRNSIVYLASPIDGHLPGLGQKRLALKVLTGNSRHPEANLIRLQREASAMLACKHPNVVRVYDFVTTPDECYVCMELAERGDLAELLEKQDAPLNPKTALNIIRQVLSGLDALHASGIIHCDIKPENLLLTDEQTIKIADFGIASLPTDRKSAEDIARGVGTLDYLAPEVLNGTGYSPSIDLYSAGVTLYVLLTRSSPFAEGTLTEQIEAKMKGRRIPLSLFLPEVPIGIETLLDCALAVDPLHRFRSAADFIAAIDDVLVGQVPEKPRYHVVTAPGNAELVHLEALSSDGSNGHSANENSPYFQYDEAHEPLAKIASRSSRSGVSRNLVNVISSLALSKGKKRIRPVVTVAALILILLFGARISGIGVAMERFGARHSDRTLASIKHTGLLYDFLGEKRDVTLVTTSTNLEGKLLLSLGLSGFTPSPVDLETLTQAGEMRIRGNGLEIVLLNDAGSVSKAGRDIKDSYASGRYRELGTGREGRWALWR